jgi:hypothetical protein
MPPSPGWSGRTAAQRTCRASQTPRVRRESACRGPRAARARQRRPVASLTPSAPEQLREGALRVDRTFARGDDQCAHTRGSPVPSTAGLGGQRPRRLDLARHLQRYECAQIFAGGNFAASAKSAAAVHIGWSSSCGPPSSRGNGTPPSDLSPSAEPSPRRCAVDADAASWLVAVCVTGAEAAEVVCRVLPDGGQRRGATASSSARRICEPTCVRVQPIHSPAGRWLRCVRCPA